MISTDINWPSLLPFPQFDPNRMVPGKTFLRTRMASGRSRQRRQFTSVPTEGAVAWIMRHEESAAFEAWFRDVLLDGANWFNMPRRTPIMNGLLSQITRFTSMPEPEPVGKLYWRYSATVETWGRPVDVIPPGWGAFPEYLVGASIIDLAINREWPEAS